MSYVVNISFDINNIYAIYYSKYGKYGVKQASRERKTDCIEK